MEIPVENVTKLVALNALKVQRNTVSLMEVGGDALWRVVPRVREINRFVQLTAEERDVAWRDASSPPLEGHASAPDMEEGNAVKWLAALNLPSPAPCIV